jgi:hypothetical protein
LRFFPSFLDYSVDSKIGSGPNSRTSQLFISYMKDGGSLGTQVWETPIGRVIEGFETVVQQFYSEYGDMPPWGKGPVQQKIHGTDGLLYITDNFPLLDHFLECQVVRKPSQNANTDIDAHRELMAGMGANRENPHSHHVQHNVRSPKHLHHHSQKEHRDGHHHANVDANHLPTGIDHDGDHHMPNEEIPQQQQRIVTAAVGELHHAHTVHFNAAPNEEGLTKLSWELVATCLLLFSAVLMLWLRFALCSPKKIRAARQRKSK